MAGREVSIYWVGSPKFTSGHPAPLIALVHHRMVGTLRSTDAAFTSPDGREASTHFGVGYCWRQTTMCARPGFADHHGRRSGIGQAVQLRPRLRPAA